jgi:hypothetical protein
MTTTSRAPNIASARSSGSMVVQTRGTFDSKEARGRLGLWPALAPASLKAYPQKELRAPPGGQPSLTLNYRFD